MTKVEAERAIESILAQLEHDTEREIESVQLRGIDISKIDCPNVLQMTVDIDLRKPRLWRAK